MFLIFWGNVILILSFHIYIDDTYIHVYIDTYVYIYIYIRYFMRDAIFGFLVALLSGNKCLNKQLNCFFQFISHGQ